MKKLYKSKDNIVVSGVLGGIGEYYQIDPVVVRIFTVFIAVVTGIFPMALVYLLGAIVIPKKQKGHIESVVDVEQKDSDREEDSST